MTHSMALRALAFVTIAAATIQCTDSTAPRVLDNSIGVIVSGLVHPVSAAASAPSSTALPTRAAYVSLSPNAVAAGVSATITNQATGLFVTTPVIDGGFDPVPIPANEGDTLAIVITVTPPAAPVHVYVIAAVRRPPRIVRSHPPSGGRDVPLNATMVVVFSEPVHPATFDTASLQLFRDTARVLGTVQLAGGANLIAEFQPLNRLAAQTAYQLSVSPQIHGVGGLAVPETSPIQFTTGTSVQAQAAVKLAFTVQPTNMTAGNVLSPVVVAIQDSLGNTVTSANDVVFMRSCVSGSSCDSTFFVSPLSGGVSVQAINGLATFSALYTGAAAKGYTLVATSGTLAPAMSAPFDISPRGPAQLQFVKLGRATVGQPFAVDVAIEDDFYNEVPSATNAVTLSLASGPAGGTLTGTLTANAVNGVAHFTGLSVDQPGTFTLAAAANALTGITGAVTAYTAGAFVAVSAGANHTCGLTIDGVAHCWGLNDHGQLGDGTTTNRTVPVSVAGGLTFYTVVTGGSHTCGHSTTGPWYCWGANASGQLGDGTTSDQWSPVALAGGLQLDGLSAGGSHTCGSVSRRDLEELFYCWGLNDHGQLGDGTTTERTSPTLVSGIGLAYGPIVAGGNHTCAQNDDTGKSFCWGANNHGQLNDGTTSDRTTAFSFGGVPCGSGPPGFVPPFNWDGCPIGAVTPFDGITTGGAHTCAAAGGSYYTSFAWYCWGANDSGQLGDGTTTDRLGPVVVNGGQPFGLVSAGDHHTCGIGENTSGLFVLTGIAYCWGSNSNGELGDGTMTPRPSPVVVAGGLKFLSVSAGGSHTCGVTLTGVYCWGSNAAGQLGNGGTTDSNVPVKVAGQ